MDKIRKGVFTLCTVLLAGPLYAQCANSPQRPTILESSQLHIEQLQPISDEMETYDTQVKQYLACLESAITQLPLSATAHPEEYYSSDEYFSSADYQTYQAQFDALQTQYDAGQAERNDAFDQFDSLATNAVQQPTE